MEYKTIDLASYKRRDHFAYFNTLAYPYVGVTSNVEISGLLEKIKREGLPFFLTVCYCAARAANSVPELRQRIVDGGIVEFTRCRTSHTVALEDGTYCYCTLDSGVPFSEYLTVGAQAQEAAKRQRRSSQSPTRRTATRGLPGGGISPRRGRSCCQCPSCATTPWWTGSIWRRSTRL